MSFRNDNVQAHAATVNVSYAGRMGELVQMEVAEALKKPSASRIKEAQRRRAKYLACLDGVLAADALAEGALAHCRLLEAAE